MKKKNLKRKKLNLILSCRNPNCSKYDVAQCWQIVMSFANFLDDICCLP